MNNLFKITRLFKPKLGLYSLSAIKPKLSTKIKKKNIKPIPINEIYKSEHMQQLNSSKGIPVLINGKSFQYIGNL